jgi:hypothetical protein
MHVLQKIKKIKDLRFMAINGFEFCKNKCTRMHWSVQEGDAKSMNNCGLGFGHACDFGFTLLRSIFNQALA